MTTAEQILKMIDEVSPDDTEKLDEIDARVWAYLILPIDGLTVSFNGGSVYYRYAAWPKDVRTVLHHSFQHDKFTRSRDALKAIRPEGFKTWAFFDGYKEGAKYRAEMFTSEMLDEQNRTMKEIIIQTGWLPTEELAELHAIIQAIEYGRNNK